MGHVLARLAGHGLVLVPHWPYTFERPDAESDAVVVTNWRPDGAARALVDPSDAHTVPGIVDVEPGPEHAYWVIETTGFKAVWPPGFSVESTVDPTQARVRNGARVARIWSAAPQSSSNWATTARCCRSWTIGMRACQPSSRSVSSA
jgi:hypothetical protein